MAYRRHSELPSQPPPPVALLSGTAAAEGDEASNTFVLTEPAHLAQLLDNFKLIVVDVWQDNCAPCDAIAPKFDDLADIISEEHGDNVAFAKVHARAGVVRVESTPMILVYSHQNPNPIAQYSAIDGFNQFAERDFYPMLRRYKLV